MSADTGERLLVAGLQQALASKAAAPKPSEAPPTFQRRLRGRPVESTRGLLRVIERDGVVLLDDAADLFTSVSPTRRRRSGALALGGRVVEEIPFERLGRSDVVSTLQGFDERLTKPRDLRRVQPDLTLQPVTAPAVKGRVCLLVHGTFSNGDNMISEFGATDAGKAFLAKALSSYDEVLTFDHPTLSMTPMLNARRLAQLFADSGADVDTICHSRGGLVTRWWAEALDRSSRQHRVVFVGAPLAGTALAAPPNLRTGLSLLATLGKVLGDTADFAAAAVPLASVAGMLFRIFSSVTNLAARTPVVDAAIALVPGLAGLSRVSNNVELVSLRSGAASQARYFGVQADFQSEAMGWRFWRAFRKLPDVAADAIFDGPNDLVVDTASMTELSTGRILGADDVLDFGTTSEVHHTSYFRHERTLEFLGEKLELIPKSTSKPASKSTTESPPPRESAPRPTPQGARKSARKTAPKTALKAARRPARRPSSSGGSRRGARRAPASA